MWLGLSNLSGYGDWEKDPEKGNWKKNKTCHFSAGIQINMLKEKLAKPSTPKLRKSRYKVLHITLLQLFYAHAL